MSSWKHESLLSEYFQEDGLGTNPYRAHRRQSSLSHADRNAACQNIIQSLQRLQLCIVGHDLESHWLEQLLSYLSRLQTTAPARSPDEQFKHAYQLRKWIFWVPVSLLQRQKEKGPATLVLAHFYATAISLEPLFPDLGPTFCSTLARPPLESIIEVTDAMHAERDLDAAQQEIASLMQFPRHTAFVHRSAANRTYSTSVMGQGEPAYLGIDPEMLMNTSIGDLSPAFTPSSPHVPGQPLATSDSAFLTVPVPQMGFGYGTRTWGAVPSPGLPPQSYTSDPECFSGQQPNDLLHGGFVFLPSIWT